MRRCREEIAPQDLPGDLWHSLAQLHHSHPDPVGRVGTLARPAGLLAFTAAADTILAARVQLSGAETMREVNETLRAMTGDLPHDGAAYGLSSVSWPAVFSIHSSVHSTPACHPGSALL
ncbi:hypothetical protein [Streptomyces flavovirens]|uniref:hypothetical protein n=1 Tax=Streptomyces flavovirens TaxID=52258 RepID=UPI003D0AB5C4